MSRGAVEVELLGDLASAGGGGGLTALDVAAWDVPGVLVGGVDEQHPAGAVEEQGAGGHTRGGEGAARVRSRLRGYVRDSNEVEPAGELVERHTARSTVVAQLREHQLPG